MTAPTTTTPRLHTSPTAAGPLLAGTLAPSFSLRCGQHCAAALDDYRGKPLVLVFYVADWHPVCTGQLERLRDVAPELERLGADLVAISPDTFWSHAAFARAHRLPFPLLSDDGPRAAIARAYGVYDAQKDTPHRALFVVDASGAVAWSASFPEALDPGVDGILTSLEALDGAAQTGVPGVARPEPVDAAHNATVCRRCLAVAERPPG